MDSIAARGVRFDRAYCPQPLCTPSRASMMTGRMPHEIGVTWNSQGIPPQFRAYEAGTLLGYAGYECVYGGKWHVPSAAIPEGHGFRKISGFNDYELTDACVAFLRDRGERIARAGDGERDRPFFMVASFDNPHNICEWARGQDLPWGNVPDAPPAECPALPANHEPPTDEATLIREAQAACPKLYPGRDFTADRWRQYRHAYFRLVEKVDAMIGRVLAALHEAGLEENTLVIFLSDHGDGMGAHRWNQKTLFYDEVIRVPLLVAGPGVRRGGIDAEHLISTGLDVLPTLCEAARVRAPFGLDGRSLWPMLRGDEPESWRDHLVCETRWGDLEIADASGRMVVSRGHKYCAWSRGEHREQLFDLRADPGEMTNAANRESMRDVVERHRAWLRAWIAHTGDRFVVA